MWATGALYPLTLAENQQILDEVVVVGYGTTSRPKI